MIAAEGHERRDESSSSLSRGFPELWVDLGGEVGHIETCEQRERQWSLWSSTLKEYVIFLLCQTRIPSSLVDLHIIEPCVQIV